MTPKIDPTSTAAATLSVAEHTDLLVVGAGPAGLAAAIEAAGRGLSVVLVDENPVPAETMGDDVPLHFGGRMSGAVRNRNAMTEALVASEPLLQAAFEAGVNVRLGTIAWGLYGNGPSVSWLPGLVAGVSDGAASFMIGFKSAIVAAGRRDIGLAFAGWEQPGVMGATAAERLAVRCGALASRRVVMLGSSAEALSTVLALQGAGIEVAAVVEQAAAPVGPAALVAAVAAAGIPLLTGHVIAHADGGPDGVSAATLVHAGAAVTIACDSILLGIESVPVVELLDALGCRMMFSAARGGHVPLTDDAHMTSIGGIYAVGDCAGVWAAKTMDRGIAEAEGRRAAAHAAGSVQEPAAAPGEPAYDLAAYRLDWVRRAVVEPNTAAYVCQCEEVTARDIIEVRPPRYLGWTGKHHNDPDLTALLGNGPPSPDQVKRLTRAGMGLCQGRRCREQVAALLALAGHVSLAEVPLASHRAPVRPLPLGLVGSLPESAEMARHWPIWFGIDGQVTPYWNIPPLPAEGAG
jgi:thioredoxin reductase